MPSRAESRVSKMSTWYHQTREIEVLSQAMFEVRWRKEFNKAVNLINFKLSRRYDHDGRTVATLSEENVFD